MNGRTKNFISENKQRFLNLNLIKRKLTVIKDGKVLEKANVRFIICAQSIIKALQLLHFAQTFSSSSPSSEVRVSASFSFEMKSSDRNLISLETKLS